MSFSLTIKSAFFFFYELNKHLGVTRPLPLHSGLPWKKEVGGKRKDAGEEWMEEKRGEGSWEWGGKEWEEGRGGEESVEEVGGRSGVRRISEEI